MKVTKVFRTDNDTILIVNAHTDGTGVDHRYVSVTADEIAPMLLSDAKKQVREHLEDGDLWKGAVQAGHTKLGLEDWVEWVIDNEGELANFDNSLYNSEVNLYDGSIQHDDDYVFESRSCGCQHDEIKEVTDLFNEIITLHINSSKTAIAKAEKIILKLNEDMIDVDDEIIRITKEIVNAD